MEVQTSRDSVLWQTDARYQYYKHGPLARIVLGDQQVQGIDYAYTLQGWLKGVNSIAVDSLRDMGGDGLIGGVNQNTARDMYGFALNYYTGDYTPINTGVSPFPGYSGYMPAGTYKPLYNGNISSMAVTLDPLKTVGTGGRTSFYNYTYDQLNRLTDQDVFNNFNVGTNSWSAITSLTQFRERITYDANGNILKYLRTSNSTATNNRMDSLSYQYYTGTNRLQKIRDSVPAGVSGTYLDIDDQPVNNYKYDSIGNLIRDSSESITNVKWSVYGKPLEITRTATAGNTLTKLTYTYDAQGNRISKSVQGTGSTISYTWYAQDAQGNLLCMYTLSGTSPSASGVAASKWVMYGSSRLGTYNYQVGMNGGAESIGNVHGFADRREIRFYELTNHLGNELATITDRKTAVPLPANSSLISYYVAEAANAQEYTPFGQRTPGRLFTVGSGFNTQFGFNGKEKDNELKGEWNSYDYGNRFYDPRVGRFLSVDPLARQFPWYTPYQYAGNKPIAASDLDGMEEWMKTQENLLRQRTIDKIDNLRVQFYSKRTYLSSVPPKDQYQEQQQREYRIKRYQELGFNDDGSKPALMRLAQTKMFKNFADNIAFPLLNGLAVVDGIYSLTKLAPALETFSAAKKVGFIRDVLGVAKDQNIGFLEGQIGNTKINNIGVSGQKSTLGTVSMVNEQNRVFTTQVVGGYDRLFDSEVKLLENFAETYKNNPNIEGTLKLT